MLTKWLQLAIVCVGIVVVSAFKFFVPTAPDNNIVEEIAENVIKAETGYDIDLIEVEKIVEDIDGKPSSDTPPTAS